LHPLVIGAFSVFATWNDQRSGGWTVRDPVLAYLEPRDLTMPLSITIATLVVLGFVGLLARPVRLMRGVQAYQLMLCLRAASLLLIPLEPPPGMIHLDDPVVRWFTGSTWRRDLFFSGHVATLFVVALTYFRCDRRVAWALMGSTALVALGLLAQHAHYTMDVVAAPVFAWASQAGVDTLLRRRA
jgi:hypothetical protein